MDVRITVHADDADRVVRQLALFFSDLRWFWPEVIPLVTSWWRQQFETQGGFAGAPWLPLSARYLGRKISLGLRPQILQATGQLKQAASQPRIIRTPTALTMTIDDAGDKHGPVLQYHQEGKGVPKRPLVFGDPLPPAAARDLEGAADAAVRDLLRRIL